LALRRLDAALRLGRRELERLVKLGESRAIDGAAMCHAVAFNGLAGGLPLAGLRQTLADELAASRRAANLDALLSLLEHELPSQADADRVVRDPRLSTIQPDLIGEAAIIAAFTGSSTRQAEAPTIVRRAYALGPDGAAQSLVRLVQDFAYALEERGATEDEKAAGRQVMGWLLTLTREIEDAEQLEPLAEALPSNTTILREIAAELTARIAAFYRREAERNNHWTVVDRAAGWTNNLAVRLGALGRREAALEAAEEAVRLRRDLAAARPDAFTPDLAASLNNLAALLSALGRREAALAAAEEAVRLYRDLAAARPDAFTPDLARSLWVLGDLLAEAGHSEQALSTLREGVARLTPAFAALPAAYSDLMIGIVRSYVSQCDALGCEPDMVLLAPVLAVFKRLQSEGSEG